MKKLIKIIFVLIIILTFVFIFRTPVRTKIKPLVDKINILFGLVTIPCSEPILYSLGTLDKNFNISKEDFLKALTEAENIWEKKLNIDLFKYDQTKGDLKINLIYDYRQEATDKLKDLGVIVKKDQATYNLLQTKYNDFKNSYNQLKIEYENDLALFNNNNYIYQQQVITWNKKGGAPEKEFALLEADKKDLQTKLAELQKKQSEINDLISKINSLVVTLNHLGTSLNLTAEKYNTIGTSRCEIFDKAVYQSVNNTHQIDIYEFTERASLIRVLAHELGHALGMEHVANPKSIMYPLNESSNYNLTTDDIKELKAVCELK